MRLQIILSALCAVGVQSQLNFGGNSETTTTTPQPSVDTRGGLLADVIGIDRILGYSHDLSVGLLYYYDSNSSILTN